MKTQELNKEKKWRRFKVKGSKEDMQNLDNLVTSKKLTREDLLLIFKCLELRTFEENKTENIPFSTINIVTKENELIVSITRNNIIEKDGYKVICVP